MLKSMYLGKVSSLLHSSGLILFGTFFVLAMATRARLSVEERIRVVVPNKEGYSLKSIAERLKIGRRTVQEIIKEYAERGSVQE